MDKKDCGPRRLTAIDRLTGRRMDIGILTAPKDMPNQQAGGEGRSNQNIVGRTCKK